MSRPDAIVESAIDWMVRLRSGAMDDRQRAAMQAWLAEDSRHRQAWERLLRIVGGAESLRDRAGDARAVLLRPQRRAVLRSLLLAALAGGGVALLADRHTPLRTLTADLRTGTGQRRRFDLDDGSQVTLNARSAVDVTFDARLRRLHLRQGEMLVQVAGDPARPFVVACAEGTARALGTRFCLRQEAGATAVAVLEHSVELRARNGAAVLLAQGQATRLRADGIGSVTAAADAGVDWTEGRLSVIDVPLAEVIERLRPYRRGLLRLAPEAARLRVQGVFPLDDSDRTLQALAETLPIRLHHYGPMTLIEAAA